MKFNIFNNIRIVIFMLSIFCVGNSFSQEKVQLSINGENRQSINVSLYDSDGGDFLLKFPITFSITDKNILIMMLGNDEYLPNDYKVWIFNYPQNISELINQNRNVGGSKKFIRNNNELLSFLKSNDNIRIYKEFDNGYETIIKSPKPVFLRIINKSKLKEMEFQFYVTLNEKKYPDMFKAKCAPVKIRIQID